MSTLIKYKLNFRSMEYDEVDTKITFQCHNCKGGFKIYENTSESCLFHPKNLKILREYGRQKPQDSPPCTKSYHVLTP